MVFFFIIFTAAAGIANLMLHLHLDRHADRLIAYYNCLAEPQNRKTLSPDYFSNRMFWRGLSSNVLADFARRHRDLSRNPFIGAQEYRRLRPYLLAVYLLENIVPPIFILFVFAYYGFNGYL